MTSPQTTTAQIPALIRPTGVQSGGLGSGRIELRQDGRIGIVQMVSSPQRLIADPAGSFLYARWGEAFVVLQRDGINGYAGVDALQYSGRHPVARATYAHRDFDLSLVSTVFSPLVPHELERATVPATVFIFNARNVGTETKTLELGFSWESLLGCGGVGARGESLHANRTGTTIGAWQDGDLGGLHFMLPKPSHADLQTLNHWGHSALSVHEPVGFETVALGFWNTLLDLPQVLAALSNGYLDPRFDGASLPDLERSLNARQEKPPSWDDPDPRFGGGRKGIEGMIHPAAVLAVRGKLDPGQQVQIPFFVTWHCPHMVTADDGKDHGRYGHHHGDALTVAKKISATWQDDLADTCALSDHLDQSDLPSWLADKLINDSTPITTNAVITARKELYTIESSPMMFGSTGTLDQRLVSHPGTSLFWPQLNRTELRCFGTIQAADGRLPHFNGNVHRTLGSSSVDYGVTDWPDLSMSFIIQVYGDLISSGKRDFLDEHWPTILSAWTWLVSRDQDGDGIPEGGSSWDVEHLPGAFIATAGLWVTTCEVMQQLGEIVGNEEIARSAYAQCKKARTAVDTLWNGEYYDKFLDPTDGRRSNHCFIGQLEGDWQARQLGLPPVMPVEKARAAARACYQRNGDTSRHRLAPIRTEPDGSLSQQRYAWHAWPQYTMVFLDCASLYLGLRDLAWKSLLNFDQVMRELNGSPWAATLWHDCRTGLPDFHFYGADWYMNGPAVWWVLAALNGMTDDQWHRRLVLGPVQDGDRLSVVWPVVTSHWWGRIERQDSAESSDVVVRLMIDRIFGKSPREHTWESLRLRMPATDVKVNGVPCPLTPVGDAYIDVSLKNPISVEPGLELQLLIR